MEGFIYQKQDFENDAWSIWSNQWRDIMTGVMWACFLVCLMSRAALCWKSCRWWMSLSVKPKSNELQLSGGYKRKNKLFCSTWSTCYKTTCSFYCCQKFDDFSNHVDFVSTWLTQCAELLLHTEMRVKYYRFFTWGLVKTVESPIFIVEMLGFFKRDVEPVITKSFVLLFSWCLLTTIHLSISSMHFSSLAMAHAVSCVLKHIYSCCVSSVYMWYSSPYIGMISTSSTAVYIVNKMGPPS